MIVGGWLEKLFGKRDERTVEQQRLCIGFFGNFVLLATPTGFFVVNRDQFESLRLRALSESDDREYGRLLIGPAEIFDPKNAAGIQKQRQRKSYEDRICEFISDEYIQAWLRFNKDGEGHPPRFERKDFWVDSIEQGIEQGVVIAIAAIEWGWSGYGDYQFEELNGPVPGTLISQKDYDSIFIPSPDLRSVCVWHTKAVFRYPGRSIIVDLIQPSWESLESSATKD